MPPDANVFIVDPLRGHVSYRDLIASEGTIVFRMSVGPDWPADDVVFASVAAEGYHMEIGINSRRFYIARNQHRCEHRLAPPELGVTNSQFAATWGPCSLTCSVQGIRTPEEVEAMVKDGRIGASQVDQLDQADIDAVLREFETPRDSEEVLRVQKVDAAARKFGAR